MALVAQPAAHHRGRRPRRRRRAAAERALGDSRPTGSLTLESRYAKPRSVTVNCVDGAWFDIKNMGVSGGPTADARRNTSSARRSWSSARKRAKHFFPGVEPDRTRAADRPACPTR